VSGGAKGAGEIERGWKRSGYGESLAQTVKGGFSGPCSYKFATAGCWHDSQRGRRRYFSTRRNSPSLALTATLSLASSGLVPYMMCQMSSLVTPLELST